MPRNVEDIIPSNKRSIRDVPVPDDRRRHARRASDRREADDAVEVPIHKSHAAAAHIEEPVVRETTTTSHTEYRETPLPRMTPSFAKASKKSGKKGRGFWIAGILACIVIAFAIFSFLKSATLAYTPKSAPLTFASESYTAYKTGGDGILLFSVVKISDSKGMPVQATGDTPVSRKATGTIIVYNNASTQAQTLIKNTRFETPDGKVYRIASDISIPGKTASAPGSLEVTVTADQPGDAYNIGLSDFTLPGLKGDSRYTTIYARSKTPMTGGLVGTEKGVTPDALAAGKTSLETALKSQLIEEAQAQVPSDFILFPSLSTVSYSDLPQSSSTDSTVNLNEQGDFYGVIFKKSDLDNYLKAKKLSLPDNQSIDIPGLGSLTLAFSGDAPSDLLNASNISFTITGTTTAVWLVDETALKSDLAGVSKGDLGSVLKNYPGIQSANAAIHPFWKTSFPSDPADITIKRNTVK